MLSRKYITQSTSTHSFLVLLLLWQILMAAGDTFRAAASDQLEIWAERTGCEIVVAEGEKAKASSGSN